MTRLPALGSRGQGWVAIQSVLLVLVGSAGRLGPHWAGELRVATSVIGAMLIIGGIALVARAIRDLAERQSFTALPFPRPEGTLVVDGAFGLVRHPVYSGLIIGAAGWGLLTASAGTLLLTVGLYLFFDLKSRREEAWLVLRFPEYAGYRERTPRLIPWIGAARG